MDNFGQLAGYQLQETHRAIGAADKWAVNAQQWRSYAEGLEKDLQRSLDQRDGASGVRAALLEEIKQNLPMSPLTNVAERTKIFNAAVNKGRVKRDLQPLSEQELAKL